MTNYTWTAPGGDWIQDPHAWGPNGLPTSGDTATISAGYVYDWNASTLGLYAIGNQNAALAPLLILLGTTGMGSETVGYANVVNYGNAGVDAYVGTGEYWTPNPGGYLNLYNYGAVHGNIVVSCVGQSFINMLGGGSFEGTITFAEGYHGGNALSTITNNLMPGTIINDDSWGAGNGPGAPITFSGRADTSDIFNIGGGSQLNLTQMQFMPSVNLESDFARVNFDDYFSNNIQAVYHGGVLTIEDFGLGRQLSLNVAAPVRKVDPNSTLTLFEPQHTGSVFYGLTLADADASGPGVIHPAIV